jgi:D-beta-D-heptose 7-phosphate kinase/D-beta-D-heptose 1-phosphate adenosyltransferase
VADRRTTTKTRIIAHSQQLLRIDEEHTAPISSDDAERMLSRIERVLPGADCAVISDYGKGVLTRELLARIIDRAKSRGVPVIVDPKGTDYSRYAGASVLTPNRHEAYAAAGAAQDGHTAVSEIGSRLIESLEIGALLITEGEHGMTLFQHGHSPMHIPAAARAVYDVTGAGDAVVAALALSLAAGASLPSATYLANLAGGLAVEQVGTAAVSAQQVEALFEDHSRALPSFPEVRAGKAVQ